jgi:L-fucose mutarotase
MLKGLSPLLTPDLLYALAQMGHGDEIALVDRNFPAVAASRQVIRLDGVDLPEAARTVLSVLPLDTFTPDPLKAMQVVGDPSTVPEVQQDVVRIATDMEARPIPLTHLERFAFYEHTRTVFATVTTTEPRPYGCVILTKGVIN